MNTKCMKVGTYTFAGILIIVAIYCQAVNAETATEVKTDKNAYVYGETIKVSFSNAPGSQRDWICLALADTQDTEAGDYQYIPYGVTQGMLTFDTPKPGRYEVRAYYNYLNKGYSVAARYAFSVNGNPEYDKNLEKTMETIERKVNPNNPLEANLPPENGLVYVFREPAPISDPVDIQIKVNGKPTVTMPGATYYPFSVPAGSVKIASGKITDLLPFNGYMRSREDVWCVRSDEVAVQVKPGHIYYAKVKIIPMGGWGVFMGIVPYQEGAHYIDTYKLTLLK